MRGGEANDLRQALSDMVRNVGPDNGVIVRRTTRAAAAGADDLLERIERGEADDVGVALNTPDGGGEGGDEPAERFMWDWSTWDGGDLWGE
jgi:hypothetical protein